MNDTDFREAVRERARRINDSADLLAIVGQNVALHGSGRAYRGPCPLHGGDGDNFSVFYRGNRWLWRCHSQCGTGTAIDYIMKRDDLTSISKACDIIEDTPTTNRLPTQLDRKPPPDPATLAQAAWKFTERLDDDVPEIGMSARDWWHRKGMSDEGIDRFWLGACPNCPTAWRKGDPRGVVHPSATIPIWQGGKVVAIRHRLLDPITPKDKYRPHVAGQGLHLVNADSLVDSSVREALVIEGEIKCYVACDLGLDSLMPVITTTGGFTSWDGHDDEGQSYGERWAALLPRSRFDKVYFLFDNEQKAHRAAEQTARRWFGRRGYPVFLPGKLDDLLVVKFTTTVQLLINVLSNATPAR